MKRTKFKLLDLLTVSLEYQPELVQIQIYKKTVL